MKIRISLLFALIWLVLCLRIIFLARTLFYAAWVIGIFSIPVSYVANGIGYVMKDIRIELAALTIFGPLQYGAIGYILTRLWGRLRIRTR